MYRGRKIGPITIPWYASPPRAEAGDISPYHDAFSHSHEASVEEYRDDIDTLFQMIKFWL
jgi:hypothetical protein